LEFLLENILNLVGFLVGLAIGIMSYIGFRNTGSPTLFRLTIAFLACHTLDLEIQVVQHYLD